MHHGLSSGYALRGEEYAILVEQAPIMIWRAGPNGLCDYFNSRWLEFRGRTLQEEVGEGWVEGVHPDDSARCLQIYLTAFGRCEAFEMDYRLLRSDAAYRWILDRGVPMHGDQGEFLGYIGSCTDVTDRIEPQRALDARLTEELASLRRLLPICSNCKCIRDEQGNWEQVEVYVSTHSNIQLTHGLCPNCLGVFYRDAGAARI